MHYKYLIQTALFRVGVERFERDLSRCLDAGWRPEYVEVKPFGWFRVLLVARLVRSGEGE